MTEVFLSLEVLIFASGKTSSSMASLLVLITAIILKTTQSLSSCIESNTPVTNLALTDLTNSGWTQCYLEPYSTVLNLVDILTDCPMGEDYYLFVGATEFANSTSAYLGAFGPSEVCSISIFDGINRNF